VLSIKPKRLTVASQALRIGICAPSSPLPLLELKYGVEKLQESGFLVHVHPYARNRRFLFSESDEKRVQSILDYAYNPHIDILWAGRGGYGANRLLPLLESQIKKKSKLPPKKLFIGFSDSTALFEFFRKKLGWSVLHASMPATQSFYYLSSKDQKTLFSMVQKNQSLKKKYFFKPKPSQWINTPIGFNEMAPLYGGNLALWCALLGTPYPIKAQNHFLFFEDIGEPLSRIDRMLQQLDQAQVFHQAKAIVLGTFEGCEDKVSQMWDPKLKEINPRLLKNQKIKHVPLRKTYSQKKTLTEIWGEISERRKIPLILGLPSGHGVSQYPLAYGGMYRISRNHGIALENWSWLDL